MLPLLLASIGALLCGALCFLDALNDRIHFDQVLFEDEILKLNVSSNFPRFKLILGNHIILYLSLMMQRSLESIFYVVATIFFYQYWGKS